MQQDTLRDFLKFFRFHLPWFVLSAGFFAVIIIAGIFFSSRLGSVPQEGQNAVEEQVALALPSPEINEPEKPIEPTEPNQAPIAPLETPEAQPPKVPSPVVASPSPTSSPTVERSSAEKPIADSAYTVQRGDTLWSISVKKYGAGDSYSRISQANKLSNPSQIYVGQKLVLPAKTSDGQIASGVSIDHGDNAATTAEKYTIVRGDSLWKIAEQELGDAYRWTEIYELNRSTVGSNPDLIYPDVSLRLPSSGGQAAQSSGGSSSTSQAPTTPATSSSSINPSFNWTSSLLK